MKYKLYFNKAHINFTFVGVTILQQAFKTQTLEP